MKFFGSVSITNFCLHDNCFTKRKKASLNFAMKYGQKERSGAKTIEFNYEKVLI